MGRGILLMIASGERDGLTELLDDLEFFLEIAEDSIEERDQIIRELVMTLEAMANAEGGSRYDAQIEACRAVIAKARVIVPC